MTLDDLVERLEILADELEQDSHYSVVGMLRATAERARREGVTAKSRTEAEAANRKECGG